jgi:hypothetical protein
MLRRAGTDKTDEEMIHEELSGKIKRVLTFMSEPYPWYPFNLWFSWRFEKIVASLAPK